MASEPLARRVVTGHDDSGRPVIVSDAKIPLERIAIGGADLGLLWTTTNFPVDNNDRTDGRDRDAGLTLHGGTVLRIGDLLPGMVSPMHRSNSIDYGVVLSGQVELELEGGEIVLLDPGDVVVQRGTLHAWRNPSATQVARILWVLIEAKPYTHNGLPYEEIHP